MPYLHPPKFLLRGGDIIYSHTILIVNHVRLHSSQNVSYTGNVCDLHLRLTAKPHICVICSTFHTEVSTHLHLCSTHNLLIVAGDLMLFELIVVRVHCIVCIVCDWRSHDYLVVRI